MKETGAFESTPVEEDLTSRQERGERVPKTLYGSRRVGRKRWGLMCGACASTFGLRLFGLEKSAL